MRVLSEIPHPAVKITIFAWNGKYIIKLEKGSLEQTYKVSEMDILDEADIPKLLDETFINNALQRFGEMSKALHDAQERLEFS
ncbi:hypothetical protein AAE02nite_00510 [Adhaeribacter aerolatus]|uniref:Uncharacterized protein n=1 Tax=Adhaeribacter aerolatus TaxID=670289 RepID=A0A512AS46_9BACT|nr:hypothetical protein [Adhaeribacter aerolatus]GEO02387.1 hypothetical protein AAE02nite_00510 [Adhaeribacter aerolatus]